jgi:hypothetical protein
MKLQSETVSVFNNLPTSAIIAVVQVSTNKVYLSLAHDTIASITRIKQFIKNNKIETSDIQVYIHESINNRNILLLHLAYYEQMYSYSHIIVDNRNRPITRLNGLYYKVRVDIDQDYKAVVTIANKRKERVIVGVFDSIAEAEEFRDLYYTGKVVFPVIARNELTRARRSLRVE